MKNSPIRGTGVDIVENKRIRKMITKWGDKFIDRVFLKKEQAYCKAKAEPSMHYAARFAVKEAVSKAFGTGMGKHISWLDIEVVNDPKTGAPSVVLNGKAKKLAKRLSVSNVIVSLSHTKEYSLAQALLLK
jgi:holo-[acyl-carrier protein] synthase